jgi:RNA recognition motif-containing protein
LIKPPFSFEWRLFLFANPGKSFNDCHSEKQWMVEPIQRKWIKMETKLYVGNLSYDTTEDGVRTLFAKAGTVVSVDIIKDRDTGRMKGFAFVTMNSDEEAQNAIKILNEKMLDDRAIRVNIAKPREEQPRRSSDNRRY